MTEVELRHGYSMADLHDVTRFAVHLAGRLAASWWERYETAWLAIAEYLMAASEPPQRYELIRAGRVAIYDAMTDDWHHYGYYRFKNDGDRHGMASSPAFRKFWWDHLGSTPSPESAIVERVTLSQVWAALSPTEQRVLSLCALYDGDYAAAAAAYGTAESGYRTALMRARNRAAALWHGDETPHRTSTYAFRRMRARRQQQECGTVHAAWVHRRRKESLDGPCAAAEAAYRRTRA